MRNQKRNINQIFYPIGFISLVLLPIMCLWFLNKNRVFRKETMISISMPNEYWEKENLKEYNFKLHPERKFTEINITGNEKEDIIKFSFAELEIRELVKTHDIIKGVKFHFDDTAKYWSLIRAIDICDEEGAKIYVLKGSDLWVYNMPKAKKANIIIEPLMMCGGCYYYEEPKHNVTSEVYKYLHLLVKDYLSILISFIVFSILTLYLTIKKTKNYV